MKKIKYLLTSGFLFVLSAPVALAAKNTCSDKASDTDACKSVMSVCIDKKIPNTVHTVILVLQIVVPVLLVIFGMIDMIKAITAGKEDEIKKAQGTFVRRLIMGALVFFVIVIVKLIFNFATNNDEQGLWNCVEAFLNGVK